MHSISIAYKAAGSDGPARRHIDRTLPSRWQDLKPEQAWQSMDMIIRGCPRRQLTEHLLQLPVIIQELLSREEMYDLQRCLTWMEIDAASITPIAPYIDIPDDGSHAVPTLESRRLYLPTDRMATTTLLEYLLVDEVYTQYIAEDQDQERELRLVALVCRPAGPSPYSTADPRVQLLTMEQTDEWMPLVRQMPESIRVYVVTLISAFRKFVYDTYGHWLFGSDPIKPRGDETDETVGIKPPDDDELNFGWYGVALDVAGDGTFGTYDQVLHSLFHSVAMHMVRKIDEARRLSIERDHAAARS
jgi:hypothetical protein